MGYVLLQRHIGVVGVSIVERGIGGWSVDSAVDGVGVGSKYSGESGEIVTVAVSVLICVPAALDIVDIVVMPRGDSCHACVVNWSSCGDGTLHAIVVFVVVGVVGGVSAEDGVGAHGKCCTFSAVGCRLVPGDKLRGVAVLDFSLVPGDKLCDGKLRKLRGFSALGVRDLVGVVAGGVVTRNDLRNLRLRWSRSFVISC